MNKLAKFILIFLPLIASAHQDRYFTYAYENVTVRFKTGFFFEELNNAKIIGQYAKLLSDSVGSDKSILLDFIHDYGHTYDGTTYSFLSMGSEEYEVISYYVVRYDSLLGENVYYGVPQSDSVRTVNNVEKEVHIVPPVNEKQGIVIRQFGYHFDIRETINLLYYALINQDDIRGKVRPDTLSSYLSNMYYCFESISRGIIDSVKAPKTPLVESLLTSKVYCEVDSINRNRLHYSYFSQNGQFHIFAAIHDEEIILDTLHQVYSFNPREYFPEVLFVFETPQTVRSYTVMTFSDNQFKRSQKHQIQIDPYEYIKSINIEWLGDDVYLFNYSNGFGWSPVKRLLYLKDDDVLIQDFENYINSYRR